MTGWVRFLLLVLLAWLLYSLLKTLGAPPKKRTEGPPKLTGVMVQDEVCHTYLPREEALREVWNGREYFFCSEECRQKFRDNKTKTSSP